MRDPYRPALIEVEVYDVPIEVTYTVLQGLVEFQSVKIKGLDVWNVIDPECLDIIEKEIYKRIETQ